MASSKGKAADIEQAVPPQRVAAFANIDLGKFIKSNPIEISETDDVDWDIEYDDGIAAAFGMLEVPVSIFFEAGDLENEVVADDLIVAKIKIGGKEVMGGEIEKAAIPFDPLATVDVARVEAQARKKRGL